LYNVALTMALLGPTPFAMRLTSAWWGLLLVALTYAWTRRAFDRPTALWTATGLALSFWGVSTSRLGLRAITLPALFTAALLALMADRRRPTADGRSPSVIRCSPFATRYLLPGLLLGLTLYTYLAARLLPAIPLLFGFYLFLTDRRRWWQRWRPWGVSLLVAALVAAPLFAYLQAHPSAEIRIGQLDQPLRLLLKGDPGPLMAKVYEGLHFFSFRGDGFIPYNIPGRPLFDPLTSLLFYAGLLIALRRWREPAYALALLWLAVGFFPALATGVDAAHLRAIAAQPVLYLFPALTLERLRTDGLRRAVPRPVVPLLVLLAFAPVALLTPAGLLPPLAQRPRRAGPLPRGPDGHRRGGAPGTGGGAGRHLQLLPRPVPRSPHLAGRAGRGQPAAALVRRSPSSLPPPRSDGPPHPA
ncbi:MAG: hypothetical protein D6759_00405, partial [Chloroflexi bacterium]